jgi:hypothetical protein
LAAGPGAAREDSTVAFDFFGSPGHGPVVAQRVKVVLVEAALPGGVHAREWRGLAEVRREDPDALLQQSGELLAVPTLGLGLAQVDDGVVDRRLSAGGKDHEVLLYGLAVQPDLGVEVRELPQADAEAFLLQVGEHLLRVHKAGAGELEVAAVGNLGPARVEVDHIRGDAFPAQLLRDLADLSPKSRSGGPSRARRSKVEGAGHVP